ncbi:phage tail tape measure protein [Halalkalibacterium halodurans]|uniref:Phage tail tape measure protein domain-containing protein n=1 Tax=Halalkalibacterium halodurans TaxID=86665 RepID=A0A0M0KJB6_ALKHA|nr:phage tail tape measure protein [Halalkalibacterium halodurans]
MAEVGALRVSLKLDSADFSRSMSDVNRKLRNVKSEMQLAKAGGDGFGNSVAGLRQKSDILNRTLTLQQERVKRLKQEYEESKRTKGEDAKETENLATRYNRAAAEMKLTEQQLAAVNRELEKQSNPLYRLGQTLDESGKKIQDFGTKTKETGDFFTTRVTLPIVGLGAAALKTGMDFEASMSNVQAISGATGSDLDLLSSKAREMGSQTSKSASEAADAFGYMALAGWDVEQMLGGIEPILRLSEAGNIDLARASDLVTDSMSALQVQVQDLPGYLDNVAEASRSSNTSIQQLMEAYVVAGGNLAQFNVPLDESTALLGLLANRGLKGSEAGRALNAIMVNLTSGAGQAGKAMKELEISAFDADGQFIGLEETLRLVKDRTKDMTDEQKAQYISMIAGKDHLKSFQGLLAGLDDEYDSLKSSVSDSTGALDNMAKTMQDNARGNITQFKSAMEELGIQFSEHMLPAFTEGVQKATDLARRFAELDSDTQGLIVRTAALTAAVGPVLSVGGRLIFGVGSLVRGVGLLATGLAGAGGLTAAFSALTGPVGIAVGLTTALGYGIYRYIKAQEEAKEINLETANSLIAQSETLSGLIDRYDELRKKSGLTVDEIGRLLDIQTELNTAQDPKVVESLHKEYEKLREKSGLTNEELDEMLGLNNQIIDQSPHVEQSFTEKGNAVVEATEAVYEYIQSLKEMALAELQGERVKYMHQEKELIEEQKKLKEEMGEIERAYNELLEYRNMSEAEAEARLEEINDKKRTGLMTQQEIEEANREIWFLERVINGELADQLETLQERRKEVAKKIELNEEELSKIYEIDKAISGILLEELNINEAGREGLRIAEKQLEELKKQREEVKERLTKEQDIDGELQRQLQNLDQSIAKHERIIDTIEKETDLTSEVNDNIRKQETAARHVNDVLTTQNDYMNKVNESQKRTNKSIDDGKGKAESMNKELGKKVDKEVKVDDKGTAKKVQDEAEKKAFKPVTLSATWTNVTSGLRAALSNFSFPGFAKGTDYHLGGPFIAGEEGWELGRMGNRWEILGPGLYSRPAGYQVFTHDESKRIMQAMQNMPAYATGARPPGEADRIVRQMNRGIEGETEPIVLQIDITNTMDGRVVGKTVERYVTEVKNRNQRVRDGFA